MTNKYNILYLVREINRWFPIFCAIVLYKYHMISCFPMLESKPSSQLYIWTKERTLQNFCVGHVLLAKLTTKKIVQNAFHDDFGLKNREQEEPGKVMAIRAFCNWTPNIWHKTTDKMSCYWKEKSYLNIWVSTGSVIMPFLLLYMNCYRNSLVQEWS